MKNLISFSKNVSWFRNLKLIHLLSVILILTVVACQKEDTFSLKNEGEPVLKSAENAKLPHQGNMVIVKTKDMDFQLPDTLRSGWTTFRYENHDHHTHFFLIEKMPEDSNGVQKDLDDYFNEVVPVFDDAMEFFFNEGDKGGGNQFLIENLPNWSFGRKNIGGVGLLGSGQIAQTTQYLEPGLYIIECYVKTDSVFHSSSEGMAAQFFVKNEKSKAKPPKPTLHLNVNDKGYTLKGHTRPGVHVMEVYYEEQSFKSNFVGHDVNIVKLDDIDHKWDVDAWMDWSDVNGLNTPAPATFLGGVQEMPGGSTAYVTFRLEPGETYGIVAEVPDPDLNGFFTTFTVNGD